VFAYFCGFLYHFVLIAIWLWTPLFLCLSLCSAIKVVQDLELSYNISLVPARCWISRRSSSSQMRVFVNAMSSHEEPAHKLAVAPPPRNPSVVHYAYCPFRHQRHYA